MRTEAEVRELLASVVGVIHVSERQGLDRRRLAGTIAMVSALEWVLGMRDDSTVLQELSRAELKAAKARKRGA